MHSEKKRSSKSDDSEGKLKTLITRMVGEKVMRVSNQAKLDEKVRGKLRNIISADMELLELMFLTLMFWSGPF
jgi:hypothetical protein